MRLWKNSGKQNTPWVRIALLLSNKNKKRLMIDKLKSRKFWALIITALLTTLGQQFGFSEETTQWLVGIGGAYIAGEGIADFGAKGREIAGKFASRKLWAYLAATLIVSVGDGLQLDPTITQWLSTLVMTYLVGQGVADAGIRRASGQVLAQGEPRPFE